MNILENLYYGNLSEYDRRIPNTIKPLQDKIANLHERVKEKLSNTDFALVEKFLDVYDEMQAKMLDDKYSRGFKTGSSFYQVYNLFLLIRTKNVQKNVQNAQKLFLKNT